jgi:hypothetical protein
MSINDVYSSWAGDLESAVDEEFHTLRATIKSTSKHNEAISDADREALINGALYLFERIEEKIKGISQRIRKEQQLVAAGEVREREKNAKRRG